MARFKKTIYLHIGTHKTGTTSIQTWAYNNRELLADNDILFPDTYDDVFKGNMSPLAWEISGDSRGANFNKINLLLKNISLTKCSKIFISAEELEFLGENSISKLKSTFSDYVVKVIVFFRPQPDLIRAEYIEWLKQGLTSEQFSTFWRVSNKLKRFNYYSMYDRWVEYFGVDNVIVHSFDDAKNEPLGVISKVIDTICPSLSELTWNSKGTHANRSDGGLLVASLRYALNRYESITGIDLSMLDFLSDEGARFSKQSTYPLYIKLKKYISDNDLKDEPFIGYNADEYLEAYNFHQENNRLMFRFCHELWDKDEFDLTSPLVSLQLSKDMISTIDGIVDDFLYRPALEKTTSISKSLQQPLVKKGKVIMQLNKIFILGDSRTGTSSLNSYLNSLGIKAKHYYVNESKQTKPDHENRDKNWQQLKSYIEDSGYQGYSDYPTRLYYKELYEAYPDSLFILTVRESTERWLKSMMGYFPKFNIQLDEKSIVKNYENINRDIVEYFKINKGNLLVLNIDDSDYENSERIKSFLSVDSKLVIGKENTTEDIDIENVTKRKVLYRTDSEDWISYVESVCGESKVLLSEKGWLYLINDSNDFFRWSYGVNKWSEQEKAKLRSIFLERDREIQKLGSRYFKYVIPEKSIVYDDFLPHIFEGKELAEDRPSNILAKVYDNAFYLAKYLKSLKGFGRLYFKGDSHTNWLGSYYIYLHIISTLNKDGVSVGLPIELGELKANVANYKGDLYTQANDIQLTDIHGVWKYFNLKDSLGYEIQYSPKAEYERVNAPEDYKTKYGATREVIITEIANSNKPTAVVFRDSTCDFVYPLLSNHFSRVVYIWHKGNVYKDIIEREKPDVVLHLMAERFVSNYHCRVPLN